jgi:fucose 4-O-acetylase-like acetyltransferase
MLIILHFVLMMAAVLLLITGIGIAMFGRKKKLWLKWHKRFNTTGFCLLAAGAAMAFANVVISAGQHLAGLHQQIGFSALVMTCLTIFLGFYSLQAANKPAVRAIHKWTGRFSGLDILCAFALGLSIIGIL